MSSQQPVRLTWRQVPPLRKRAEAQVFTLIRILPKPKPAVLIGCIVVLSCASPPKLSREGETVELIKTAQRGCVNMGNIIVQTNPAKVNRNPVRAARQSAIRARNSAVWLFNATHMVAATQITGNGEQAFVIYQCSS